MRKTHKFHLFSIFLLIFFSCSAREPLNFHCVKEGLFYRSSQPSPKALSSVIQHYHIRTVINLRGENPNQEWWQLEKKVCEHYGVKHLNIQMSALQLPSKETLLKLYDSFFEEEYPLLIHCRAGADRAGAASAIWRMVYLGDSKEEASKELSPRYFHLQHSEMDVLINLFEPSRDWILFNYTP